MSVAAAHYHSAHLPDDIPMSKGDRVPTLPVRNMTIGVMLGQVRDYSYGLSNPALRPAVPKGC